MKNVKVRTTLLVVSILLVIIVLGFAGGVDTASFKQNYTESLVASYSVKGSEPVRKIEYAVKYGKPLANFYGINEILSEAAEDSPEITDVKIVLPDGSVAYSLKDNGTDQKVSSDIRKSAFSDESYSGGKNFIKENNKYNILIPIRNREKVQIGVLDMVLDGSTVQAKVSGYFQKILFYLLLIGLASIFLIVILFFMAPLIRPDGEINIKALSFMLISVLAAGQILFGVLNYNLFRKIYIGTSKENTSIVAAVVRRDMNSVIQKGVPIKEMNGIESWLDSIVQSVPEIESLYVTDMRGEVFYKTKNLVLMQEELIDPMYNYSLPLARDNLSQKGLVNLVLSRKYVQKRLNDIALDTLTVLLTSFIFMTEIIVTLLLFLKRKKKRSKETVQEEEADDELTEIKMIRPVAFAFFFAFSMTTSFIPIVMKNFGTSLQWIPEGLRLGLPVSLEAFGTIVSTVATGYIIQKKGWRPPFFYGILIVSAGSVLSGLSWSGALFAVSRLVTGVGYGFTWMSMRGYVSTYSSESVQNQGFSSLNAGIMSGLNCGVVLGAMIAERAGYSFVFFVTVGFMTISAFIAFMLIKNNRINNAGTEASGTTMKADVIKLVSDFKVLTFILFVIIPVSVCGMFLNYLFPVEASKMGISSANIGRAFLLYGILVVYLGPLFGKYVGSRISMKKSVVFAGFICAIAVSVFGFGMNAAAAFSAVLLLGFSDSFGLAAQGSYFMNLDASKRAGSGISLAAYSFFYKIGQMLGPLILGGLVALGTAFGASLTGFITAGLILIYIILNSGKRASVKNKSLET